MSPTDFQQSSRIRAASAGSLIQPLDRLRDIAPRLRLVARAEEPTWIEVDGEPLGRLPIEIEVLPQRLNVLVDARCEWLGTSPAPRYNAFQEDAVRS